MIYNLRLYLKEKKLYFPIVPYLITFPSIGIPWYVFWLIAEHTHTFKCSVCCSYFNSLLLLSACISVLASPGIAPGIALAWLDSSGPGAYWPLPTPSTMLPRGGHSVRARDIPPLRSLPSHLRGTRCWCCLTTRGHTWGSRSRWLWNWPRGPVARKLWGLNTRSVCGRDAMGWGWALLLLVWTRCPWGDMAEEGPQGSSLPCPRREKDQRPRPTDAFGWEFWEQWHGASAESIPTLSTSGGFLSIVSSPS